MKLGWIGCASLLVDPRGLQGFFHTFNMALYHKWEVKNDFIYVLQFFSLISDSLGRVGGKETGKMHLIAVANCLLKPISMKKGFIGCP